jgi:thioesterase domain-containing protein
LPPLTVREIYECAEADYVPQPISANVILIRATEGKEIGDTPYCEIYADDDFGWGVVAQNLLICGVEGGHFSMLQEPFVRTLASVLKAHLETPFAADRRSMIKEAV